MAKKKVLSLEEKLEEALIPKKDQLYELPKNWKWVYFGSIIEIQGGSQPPKNQWSKIKTDTNVRMLQIRDFTKSRIVDAEYVEKTNKLKLCSKDDILIARYGASIGKILTGETGAYNVALVKTIFDKKNLSPNFLYNFLNSYNFQNQILANGRSRTAQAGFNKEDLNFYSFPLPPLAEQERVVKKLEDILSKTKKAKELISEAKKAFEFRKASILHKAFTGKLTAKWRKENQIDLNSWEEIKLKNVVKNFKYGTSEKSDSKFNGIPVIRIPNIVSNEFDNKDMKYLDHFDINENNKVIKDDILIIRSNGSRNIVGRCALIKKLDIEHSFASYLIRIRPDNIVPKYLLYLLNSSEIRKQFFKKSKSSAGIHNINSKELGSLNILLPGEIEQKEIVKMVEELLKAEDKAKELLDMENQIELLEKSILSKAFRGELGTNNSDDEPAMELLKRILEENNVDKIAVKKKRKVKEKKLDMLEVLTKNGKKTPEELIKLLKITSEKLLDELEKLIDNGKVKVTNNNYIEVIFDHEIEKSKN